jgi:hypothetical protein
VVAGTTRDGSQPHRKSLTKPLTGPHGEKFEVARLTMCSVRERTTTSTTAREIRSCCGLRVRVLVPGPPSARMRNACITSRSGLPPATQTRRPVHQSIHYTSPDGGQNPSAQPIVHSSLQLRDQARQREPLLSSSSRASWSDDSAVKPRDEHGPDRTGVGLGAFSRGNAR